MNQSASVRMGEYKNYEKLHDVVAEYIDHSWTDHNVAPIGNVRQMVGHNISDWFYDREDFIAGCMRVGFAIIKLKGQHGVKTCVVLNQAVLFNDIANNRTSWRIA